MNSRVVFFVLVVVAGIAWFWVVYPSYLSVVECTDAAQASIQQIEAERKKTVYVKKMDTCPIERELIAMMQACYQAKKQESFVKAVVLWYPPITFEYTKLREHHSVQCLDDSPAFFQ